MNLVRIVQIVNLVWVLSEVVLVVFARWNRPSTLPRDRGSRTLLWCAMGAGIAAGTAAQAVSAARIRIPEPWLLGVSLLLLVGGLVIRWIAILTLDRFFSTSVAIHQDHRLVRTGLFRLVRHPSYSGLLLLFLGMGLSFGNWLSFAVIVVPFLAALLYRIQVEESSLVEALGQDYVEYCRSTTKRLLPGIF
jgi:protein-S-isoprenylcysteine O-methyltransferase Ste14